MSAFISYRPAALGGGGGGSNAITALTGDVTATGPGSVPATVAFVGGQTAAAVAAVTAAVVASTAGSVLFSSGGAIAQDNANFFWNDSLNRLGIGTAAPSTTFHVKAAANGQEMIRIESSLEYGRTFYKSANASIEHLFARDVADSSKDFYWGETTDTGSYLFRGGRIEVQRGQAASGLLGAVNIGSSTSRVLTATSGDVETSFYADNTSGSGRTAFQLYGGPSLTGGVCQFAAYGPTHATRANQVEIFASSSSLAIEQDLANPITFSIAGTEAARFDGSRNFGIGVSPSALLDVNGSTRLRGLTTAGPVLTDSSGNLSSTASLVATFGGTAQTTYATGDTLYASAANTLSKRTIGSTGNVLTVAGGIPTWAPPATSGTVTSVAMTVPTFLSVSGSPVTSSGTLAVSLSGTALPEINGGTAQTTYATGDLLYASGSNTLAKRTIGSTGNVLTVSGGVPTWAPPATAGTVTSVAMTVPTFLSVSGSPVTSSGTLAVTLSGTALPVLNGGTGVTTSTGSGSNVLSTSPSFTTSILPDTNYAIGVGTDIGSSSFVWKDLYLGHQVVYSGVQPTSVGTATGTNADAFWSFTATVGGNTTIATTGTGGGGQSLSVTAGAGGQATAATTSSTGGNGGANNRTGGAGGASSVSSATASAGGAGGGAQETGGAGGAATSASGTNTGGLGGTANKTGGAGGAATGATSGANLGGAGGVAKLIGGAGGAASGSSTSNTSGAGGTVTIQAGIAGTATGTGAVQGANGTIALNTGSTDRVIIDATGQIAIQTVGKGLSIKEGSNAKMGTATMSSGTVVVSTTAVTASSRIFITVQSLGTVAVATPVAVTARSAGTSFTISSSSVTDTSVVAWMLVEPS